MNTLKPRPIGVNLQTEQKEQMLEMYKAGATTAEIARKFNVAKSTVSRLTLRAGLREPLAKAGKRLTVAEVDEIKNLYTTTYLPKQEIADRLGISFDSVQHHTKGLERVMSDSQKATIAKGYLSGDLSSEYLKEKLGITKNILYAIVRDYVGVTEEGKDA